MALAALGRLAQKRVPLGALCTGGYALAKAGLLDKYKAVIHWENMSALREEFPRVEFSDQLFAIDRDRYTCTGGVAPLDLMLHIIKQHQGRDIVPLISEQFILDRIRNDQDRQHIPLQARVGLFHENLIEAAALMEANIEEPLSLDEIAALVGVSRRQIERLFKRYVGQVPTKYYLDMRLRRSRELLLTYLQQHALPFVVEITKGKARELIRLGSLSSLGTRAKPINPDLHSFDCKEPDTTVAYHRDRGEPWADVKPVTADTLSDLVKLADECWCEYVYLFWNGHWSYKTIEEARQQTVWEPLTWENTAEVKRAQSLIDILT